MKHLYFIRHGESELNVARVFAGHTDTPLTPVGREQAAAAGKAARDQGLVFDVILSSPLQRAHHTARAIAEHTGYPLELIELIEALKERKMGDLETKDLAHFGIDSNEYLNNPLALDHIPNIETISNLHGRALKLIEELRQRPEETILIVSHGGLGRSLQRAAFGIPMTDPVEPLDNAQLVKLI